MTLFNFSNVDPNGAKGVITIKPLYAELENVNTDSLLKDAPFCVCYSGNQRFQTDKTFGRCERPEWKNSFILNHTDEEQIKVRVCCLNLRSRVLELVGEGLLHIKAIKNHTETLSNRVILYEKGTETGAIIIETLYISRKKGELAFQGYQPKPNEVLKKSHSTIIDNISDENDYIHELNTAKYAKLDSNDLFIQQKNSEDDQSDFF